MAFDRAPQTISGWDALGTSYGNPSDTYATNYAENVNFMVNVSVQGSVTSISLKVEWSQDGTVWGPQQNGTVAAGVETLVDYSVTRAVAAAGAFPFSLPTRGQRYFRVSRLVDDATGATVSVTVQRG